MKWVQRQVPELEDKLVEDFSLTSLQAKLLANRKINTAEKLDFWFNATEEQFADPFLMHDMDKAVERINQAIDNGEKITVYGDYDADGITATAIMVEVLEILGADVHYFIPNRFKDGYGPNMKRYEEIVADGTNLIITVDNGVTGVDEVAYAKSQGVDTILTDHHTFQEKVPEPYALVHCNYPKQKYPFDDYCGAGVAYTIARALMGDSMRELLDLALIGTIGDMVKVDDEGHLLTKIGLEVLNQTERPGLRALIKNAGLKLGSVTDEDIGFAIAPRLNAVGRLADASLAVALLLSDDETEAQQLADKVEELNQERKDLTQEVYQKALAQVKAHGWQNKGTLVIYDPSFHEGVLGLVANKVVQALHKPTIILTKDENGDLKGSGRAEASFNLFDALNPIKEEVLTKFGGHDFACGLSLKEENLEVLREKFEESFTGENAETIKEYDLELPLKDLSLETIQEIQALGPFGTANPAPIFSMTEPKISNFRKIGADKNHVSFTSELDNSKIKTLGFSKGYLNENLLPFIHKLYVKVSINEFRNKVSLQAMIEGIDYDSPLLTLNSPTSVIDLRQDNYIMGFADRYLLFNEKNKDWAVKNLGISADKVTLAKDYQENGEKIVLLDTPASKKDFDYVLNQDYQEIYLRFLTDSLTLTNLPNRQEFGKVWQYVVTHTGLTLDDYRKVSAYIGMQYPSILFILRVFFDVGLIKYEDDKIVPITDSAKKFLSQSRYYQSVAQGIKFTKQLHTLSSQQLINYINNYKNSLK